MFSYCLKLRRLLPPILAWLLLLMTNLAPALDASAAPPRPQPYAVKNQVLKIPKGAAIEVRLLSKETIRGELGELTDVGFTVKAPSGTSIEEKKLSFDQVRSIKYASKGHRINLRVLAVLGIVFAILGVIVGISCGTTNACGMS